MTCHWWAFLLLISTTLVRSQLFCDPYPPPIFQDFCDPGFSCGLPGCASEQFSFENFQLQANLSSYYLSNPAFSILATSDAIMKVSFDCSDQISGCAYPPENTKFGLLPVNVLAQFANGTQFSSALYAFPGGGSTSNVATISASWIVQSDNVQNGSYYSLSLWILDFYGSMVKLGSFLVCANSNNPSYTLIIHKEPYEVFSVYMISYNIYTELTILSSFLSPPNGPLHVSSIATTACLTGP